MVGWKYALLVVYLLFPIVYGENALECPSKQLSEIDCSDENKCTAAQLCLEVDKGREEFRCCDKALSHCTETGMNSFTKILNGYLLLWNSKNLESDFWYKKKVNINGEESTAACPIPLPYQLSGTMEKIIAVGFEEGGAKVKNCGKSSDCKEDEFCGHAYNPSYCKSEENVGDWNNHCLDRSNNGTPMQFCFKNPKMVNQKLKLERDRVGFDVCNEQKDCGAEMVCMMSHNSDIYKKVDSNGKTNGNEYAGICLEAHICDDSSSIAHLPKDLQSCVVGNDTSCGKNNKCVVSDMAGMALCCPSLNGGYLATLLASGKTTGVLFGVGLACTFLFAGLATFSFIKWHGREEEVVQVEPQPSPQLTPSPHPQSTPTPTLQSKAATSIMPSPVPSIMPTPSPEICETQDTQQTLAEEVPIEKTERKRKISYSGCFEFFDYLDEENQLELKEQEKRLLEERLERMRKDRTNFFRY